MTGVTEASRLCLVSMFTGDTFIVKIGLIYAVREKQQSSQLISLCFKLPGRGLVKCVMNKTTGL